MGNRLYFTKKDYAKQKTEEKQGKGLKSPQRRTDDAKTVVEVASPHPEVETKSRTTIPRNKTSQYCILCTAFRFPRP